MNEVQRKRIIVEHLSGSNKKVVGEEVAKFWTVDEEDPIIKDLIANGKIKFAFSEKYAIEDDGKRSVRYK